MIGTFRAVIIAGVAGLCLGLGAGWSLWGREKARVVEIAAPAVRQADSSLVLERKPDAHAKPKQIVPPGAVVERVVSVTVQPKPIIERSPDTSRTPIGTVQVVPRETPAAGTGAIAKVDTVKCPPVTVDLTLLRMKDGTHRVTASSPDGTVIGGVDVPVEAAVASLKPKVWSAGALYNPVSKTYGAFVTRDLGPVRAIAQTIQPDQGARWAVQVGAAIRW